jgi:hypothetical protein
MPLDQTEILRLSAALLGGGAMGAAITAIVTSYRNRIQPVRFEVKTIPIFAQAPLSESVEILLTIKEKDNKYDFKNLYLTEIKVVNTGNQNIKEFTVGITMSDTDWILNVHCDPPDRHHNAVQDGEITPSDARRIVDFKLAPFNRGDAYLFRLLSTCSEGGEPGKIKLTSSDPVKFVERLEFETSVSASVLQALVKTLSK